MTRHTNAMALKSVGYEKGIRPAMFKYLVRSPVVKLYTIREEMRESVLRIYIYYPLAGRC